MNTDPREVINPKKKIKKIQIFGERCSGTNYLESLVATNIKRIQVTWEYGWKHFFHQEGVQYAEDTLFLVIYRNPFDWLRSLHTNPWLTAPSLRSLTFSEFIRQEWWCIYDEDARVFPDDPRYGQEIIIERNPENGERFKNVIKMRTFKIQNWESLREKTKNHFYVRYEDLRKEPEVIFREMQKQFFIKIRGKFKNRGKYKGAGALYTPKIYGEISQYDVDYMLRELDIELEQYIGYDIEDIVSRL